jgi:hypothetical protein
MTTLALPRIKRRIGSLPPDLRPACVPMADPQLAAPLQAGSTKTSPASGRVARGTPSVWVRPEALTARAISSWSSGVASGRRRDLAGREKLVPGGHGDAAPKPSAAQPALKAPQLLPHREPEAKSQKAQSLHGLRLQLIGIEMAHELAEAQQLLQPRNRGGAEHGGPFGGGVAHPLQQAPVPIPPIGRAAVQHPADLQQAPLDARVGGRGPPWDQTSALARWRRRSRRAWAAAASISTCQRRSSWRCSCAQWRSSCWWWRSRGLMTAR